MNCESCVFNGASCCGDCETGNRLFIETLTGKSLEDTGLEEHLEEK